MRYEIIESYFIVFDTVVLPRKIGPFYGCVSIAK